MSWSGKISRGTSLRALVLGGIKNSSRAARTATNITNCCWGKLQAGCEYLMGISLSLGERKAGAAAHVHGVCVCMCVRGSI
jgi:hypothetical protein